MKVPNPTERFCFLVPSDDSIKIRLYIDKNIVTGADFKLYNSTGTKVLEHWKMSAEDNRGSTKRLRTSIEDINLSKLSWHCLCCSLSPETFTGMLKIEIIQNDEVCKLTIPAEVNMNNIPPCKLNNPVSYTGTMTFMVRKEAI